MARCVLSNPGELVLFGNPSARAKQSKSKPKPKGKPMAKKKRTAAQKAATKKMIAANKRSRSKSSTKARKARKVRTVAKKAAKRTRRARKAKIHTRTVIVPKKGKARVKIYKAKRIKRRGSKRKSFPKVSSLKRRKPSKIVRVNPAFTVKGIVAPIKNFTDNLKASMGSFTGVAAMAGGAIGSVMGGTIVKRVLTDAASRIAPGFVAGPIGSRLIPFLSYYLTGFAIAKFVPMKDKTRKAVLAGAVTAGVMEAIRPGLVQETIARVPVVGPIVAGKMSTVAGLLGEYDVEGLGQYDVEGLGQYDVEGLGAADGGRWGDPDDIDDLSLSGLGCTTDDLVSFSDIDG